VWESAEYDELKQRREGRAWHTEATYHPTEEAVGGDDHGGKGDQDVSSISVAVDSKANTVQPSASVLVTVGNTAETTTTTTLWIDPPGYFDRVVWPNYLQWNRELIQSVERGDYDRERLLALHSGRQSVADMAELLVAHIVAIVQRSSS